MEPLFKVGDCAVYPARGIVEVVAIEPRDIGGSKQEFYILRVVESDATLMVPMTGVVRAGLRAVVSEEEVVGVFDVLKSDDVAVKPGPWNRRFREYTELVNSGVLLEVAQVFRDLVRIQPDRELSFGERRLLEQSRLLLVSEIALARNSDHETIGAALEGAVIG